MCTKKDSNPTIEGFHANNKGRVGYPIQVVAVDLMGPLPETADGNKYALVAVDYFTRWTEAYGYHIKKLPH